jgi:Killing trait
MPEEQNAVNDQIRDSISQISEIMRDGEGSTVRAMSYQVMAHTIAMSMYNTVHQQQQLYVLQNAATTAAIKEALKSNPAEAAKIAQQAIIDTDLTTTISQLKTMMDELNQTYKDIKTGSAKPASPPAAKPKAKNKPAQRTKK